MKSLASIFCCIALGVSKVLAYCPFLVVHPPPAPVHVPRRLEKESRVSNSVPGYLRPGLSDELYYLGITTHNGRVIHQVPTRTALPSEFGTVSLGSLLGAIGAGATDASTNGASDGPTTETITIPNGGTNIGGNGANGGSVFVDHHQVYGTPGTTETIVSQREFKSESGNENERVAHHRLRLGLDFKVGHATG